MFIQAEPLNTKSHGLLYRLLWILLNPTARPMDSFAISCQIPYMYTIPLEDFQDCCQLLPVNIKYTLSFSNYVLDTSTQVPDHLHAIILIISSARLQWAVGYVFRTEATLEKPYPVLLGFPEGGLDLISRFHNISQVFLNIVNSMKSHGLHSVALIEEGIAKKIL